MFQVFNTNILIWIASLRPVLFIPLGTQQSLNIRRTGKGALKHVTYLFKVSITNVLLWIGTWGPYAIVVLIGLIGQHQIITPLFSGLPALLGQNLKC